MVNVAYTMYPLVRKISKKIFKWRLLEEDNGEDFDLMWADHAVAPERMQKFKPH